MRILSSRVVGPNVGAESAKAGAPGPKGPFLPAEVGTCRPPIWARWVKPVRAASVAAALFGTVLGAPAWADRAIATKGYPVTVGAPLSATATPSLTVESLLGLSESGELTGGLLRSSRATTIAELVAELVRIDGDTLARRVEGFRSFSLQPGTYALPREIVFRKDGRLVLSFNGSKSTKGSNVIELMSFDKDTRRFTFREIAFRRDTRSPDHFPPADLQGEVAYLDEQAGIAVSVPNPGKCVGCHGGDREDLRPNWDSYQVWPGFYGSDDDFPRRRIDPNLLEPAEKYLYPLIGTLSRNFYRFEDVESAHHQNVATNGDPRYQVLPPIATDEDGSRMNFALTQILGELNLQRIARRLEDPRLTPYREALVAYASNCEGPSFFPAAVGVPGGPGILPDDASSLQPLMREIAADLYHYELHKLERELEEFERMGSSTASFRGPQDPLTEEERAQALALGLPPPGNQEEEAALAHAVRGGRGNTSLLNLARITNVVRGVGLSLDDWALPFFVNGGTWELVPLGDHQVRYAVHTIEDVNRSSCEAQSAGFGKTPD